MTRLSSYYGHLVQPGRSVLGKPQVTRIAPLYASASQRPLADGGAHSVDAVCTIPFPCFRIA